MLDKRILSDDLERDLLLDLCLPLLLDLLPVPVEEEWFRLLSASCSEGGHDPLTCTAALITSGNSTKRFYRESIFIAGTATFEK